MKITFYNTFLNYFSSHFVWSQITGFFFFSFLSLNIVIKNKFMKLLMLSCFMFVKNTVADTHTHMRYDKIKFKEFNMNLDIIFQNCFSLFNQVTNILFLGLLIQIRLIILDLILAKKSNSKETEYVDSFHLVYCSFNIVYVF